MKHGIIWCSHCGNPHKLRDRFCSVSGKPLDRAVHESARTLGPAALVGMTIDRRYRILSLLGSGGMGEVYEAENLALGRRVAIKVVSQRRRGTEDAVARLGREARAVAAIQHPNICDIFDVGAMPDGTPYVVLERLVGETLERRERRQRKMPPGIAIDVFGQILGGLRAAHEAGVVHRDLKPANVFLVQRQGFTPLVKLLDFGFAKITAPASELRAITRPGRACGTVQYMSPEQLRADGEVDGRTDIFSVGVMLHEALTGRHPFAAASVADIGARIMRDDPPKVSSVRSSLSPAFDAVLARALAKRREERFRSALEMQVALLALAPDPEEAPESTTDTLQLLPRLASSQTPSSSSST